MTTHVIFWSQDSVTQAHARDNTVSMTDWLTEKKVTIVEAGDGERQTE